MLLVLRPVANRTHPRQWALPRVVFLLDVLDHPTACTNSNQTPGSPSPRPRPSPPPNPFLLRTAPSPPTQPNSFGFEMETFEFLNMLQVHGFPKVMCVLTHLDKFDNVKALRATKKKLKNRFWTEVRAVRRMRTPVGCVWCFRCFVQRTAGRPPQLYTTVRPTKEVVPRGHRCRRTIVT